MSTKVLIAEQDTVRRDILREMIGAERDHEVVGLARDGQEAVQMAMLHKPQVALISYDLPGMSGTQTAETMAVVSPDVMTILVADSQSPEVFSSAMRSGARAVLTKPLDPKQLSLTIDELADANKRRGSSEILQWRDPSRFPKVIAIPSAKGGVGKSTLAANLAVTLAKEYTDQVALIDMYTQFGDIATMFNIVLRRTIADMAPMYQDIDVASLKNYITVHPSGVHILAASDSPQPLDAISADCMDTVLYLLKRNYRFVVIDVPPMLHHTTLHVLAHANLVLLIANLFDLTTSTDTKKFYDAIQAEYISKDNVRIILNRMSKVNRLHTSDIERIFGAPVMAHIPNDSLLVKAVNDGTPYVLSNSDSQFAQSMNMLAKRIIGNESSTESTVSVPPARKGIFGSRYTVKTA